LPFSVKIPGVHHIDPARIGRLVQALVRLLLESVVDNLEPIGRKWAKGIDELVFHNIAAKNNCARSPDCTTLNVA